MVPDLVAAMRRAAWPEGAPSAAWHQAQVERQQPEAAEASVAASVRVSATGVAAPHETIAGLLRHPPADLPATAVLGYGFVRASGEHVRPPPVENGPLVENSPAAGTDGPTDLTWQQIALGMQAVVGFCLTQYPDQPRGKAMTCRADEPEEQDDEAGTRDEDFEGEAGDGDGGASAPADRSALQARPGAAVLVANGRETGRAPAVAALSDLGYRVVEAPDGAAVLAALASPGLIDLVITDADPANAPLVEAARGARPDLTLLLVDDPASTARPRHDHDYDHGGPAGGHDAPHVLASPFALEMLCILVKELLG